MIYHFCAYSLLFTTIKLSIFLEDILVLSGRDKSRDKIQIVEKRKIDISYQFMYLPKFQLSNDDMKFER